MTTPTEFLKLIDAPWAAYHDHPDAETAKCLASIRPVGREYDEVCSVYLCNYPGEPGAKQRARRDLIAAAPELLEALQGIMRDLVRGPDPFGTMAKARAAIAKATGEHA